MDELKKLFESYTGQTVTDSEELNSSGSNRRYFRLRGGNISLVGVIGLNKDENNAFISLSGHFLKNGIKAIAKLCGINKNITWHQSRHSYATTICLSNGVPIETLSKMMGHTSIRSTQIYAKITAEKVSNDMERLSKQIESMEQFICQTI